MFLDPKRQTVIKNLVFLDITLLKSTIVQRFLRVKMLKYQFYNGFCSKIDTPAELAELPDPGRGLLFGTPSTSRAGVRMTVVLNKLPQIIQPQSKTLAASEN